MGKFCATFTLTTIILSGCASVPYQSGIPFNDQPLAEKLRNNVTNLYPKALRSQHRAVLSVADIQLEMTGYVLVRQPSDIRLVALNDFGNTLFEVLRNSMREDRVVNNTLPMPSRILAKTTLRDVETIYLKWPSPSALLVRYSDNTIGLVEKSSDGSMEEFRFDGKNLLLKSYSKAKNNCYLYQTDFSDYQQFAGQSKLLPRTIRIKDHRMKYELMVSILNLKPDHLDDIFFR